MKNKALLIFFIIILLLSGVLYGANEPDHSTVENVLGEGIESSGADILESTISCWGKINDIFMTAQQVEEKINKIILQLDLDENSIERLSDSNEDISKQIIYAFKDNRSYEIAIESINNGGKGETYIIADVYINKDSNDLIKEKEKLELILKGMGEQIKCNSCVIGTFNGRLNDIEIQQKLQTVLSTVKAKRVEGIEEPTISSISAYSSNIETYIMSNDKKVNIQIALRYSAYDDKTYIWVGSPLIHVEY